MMVLGDMGWNERGMGWGIGENLVVVLNLNAWNLPRMYESYPV